MSGVTWLLITVALMGCGDDAPGGMDREGAGPTNDLPLWVPAPGAIPGTNGPHQWAVSEDRTNAGQQEFLAGYVGPTSSLESNFGPSEPYFIRTYRRGSGGIYQVADTRFGTYDEPVLVVPDKVRVGMRWYGAPFGTRRFTFEVVERSEVATPDAVVWYIEVTDDERISRGPMLSQVYQGETFTLSFVEGSPAGPFAAMPETQGIEVGLPGSFIAGPPSPPAPPALPERSLRALNGGAPVVEGLVPQFIGLVNDPAHPESLGLTIEGIGAGFTGAYVFVGGVATGCGTLSRASGTVTDVEPKDCLSARGSIVDGTGRLLRIFEDGWKRAPEIESIVIVNGMMSYNYFAYQMGGIFRAADGSAQVFRVGRSVYIAPHPGAPEPLRANPFPNGVLVGDLGAIGTGGPLWFPVEDATGWTNLSYSGEGDLRAFHLTRAGVIDVEHTLQDIGGSLGMTVDSSGRHLLRTQIDGTIERVTWDRDGIHTVPIARAVVPEGHVMAAAAEDGDRILVLTLTEYRGRDVQYLLQFNEFDPTVKPDLGRVLLWEMDKP